MAAELTPAVCRWCSRPIIWSHRVNIAGSRSAWRLGPTASDICSVRLPSEEPGVAALNVIHQPELPDLSNPVHVRTWLDSVD